VYVLLLYVLTCVYFVVMLCVLTCVCFVLYVLTCVCFVASVICIIVALVTKVNHVYMVAVFTMVLLLPLLHYH